jgi:hypothetical protein
MKTLKINLAPLHNEEHFQYHTEFKDAVNQKGAQRLNIEALFNEYLSLNEQEFEALLLIRKSATTDQLAIADAERDEIFRGLADAHKSGLNHFNADKRAAATRLKVLFDQYGNVARKPYDDETADINKMMQEVSSTFAADVATLGIGDWFTELDRKNKAFDTLMKSRYTEGASKTELRMRQVRIDLDTVYRAIINRIDALMLINGDTNYESFVRELNTRVERYNTILAQRKGRNSKDTEKKAKPDEV